MPLYAPSPLGLNRFRLGAGPGIPSRPRTGGGGSNLNAETVLWLERVAAAGGTLEADSTDIADALVTALKAETFYAKLKYMLPFLGGNLAAARVPLIDVLNVGIATNTGFEDSDFSQATGLTSASGDKKLVTEVSPADLGESMNGGLGWWETNWTSPGGNPMMLGGTAIHGFELDTFQIFYWGGGTNYGGPNTTATNGHYYGQRPSATLREIYKDAVALGSNNTANDNGAMDNPDGRIAVFAMNNYAGGTTAFYHGRCAVAYMTDGTLSADEITAMHSVLDVNLKTATGR